MDKHQNIYPVDEYIKQSTNYLCKRFNINEDEAKLFVKEQLKNNKINNPITKFWFKKENGDKIKREEKLTDYIKEIINSGDVIVPSFTTYYHPSKQKSIHAEFMAYNTKRRSMYKKTAFKAKQDGDMNTFLYNDVMQKTMKIFNNSLSGAYASKSTILRNPSAHYTLTSITRCVSSIGNAISESLVYGNKHFKSSDIVYNYITTIITNINKQDIEYCINKYKLHIPTPNEVMDMILNSSKWYFNNKEVEEDIFNYISILDDIERVAILYTNDLWYMKKYNETLIRNMITKLINKQHDKLVNDTSVIRNLPEELDILTKFICCEEIKGKNVNYEELKDTELGQLLITTAYNVKSIFEYFSKLFETFFFTNILPPSIGYIKDMFRECIVLSDTDSTCGSYDKWVEWYLGKNDYSSNSIPITGVIMTINGLAIDRGLKNLSLNMNIPDDRLNVLKMKNEFYWSVFVLTNMNKHYFANTNIQEGNVFNNPELEIKGVHLIASAVNQDIAKKVHSMIKEINDTLSRNEKISILKYINEVKILEDEISKRIDQGDIEIFKKNAIKEEKAYKNSVEQSPYLHHMLWERVFASKYGSPGNPTYMCIKVPTILDNHKVLNQFLDEIQDKEIQMNLRDFLSRFNKNSFATFMLPVSIVGSRGIPLELLPIINKKRIIQDNLKSAYLVLESLGYYLKDDKIVSEML